MGANLKQRVTLFINPELLTQAKAQAIVDNNTLAELVELALINYLPKETVIKKTSLTPPSKKG